MLKALYNPGKADTGTEDPQTSSIYNPTKQSLQRAIDETLHADISIPGGNTIGRMSKEQHLYDVYVKRASERWSFQHSVTLHGNILISVKGYMGWCQQKPKSVT